MSSQAGAARKLIPDANRFLDRSFALASNLPAKELQVIEAEIQALGGSVHPFLNAVTDYLVVGCLEGTDSNAHWAREQVRRGEIYRGRWGHLEIISEEELRSALQAMRGRAV